MSERSLEDLERLSTPALAHAELVQLAREGNPTKAKQQAESQGWPQRQAKAVRFLAMVVRDFGIEALDSLISNMEHVRSQRSESEQAQEERRMQDRIRRSLERLDDPQQKLSLMLKHGLTEDASAFVRQMVAEQTAFFWMNEAGGQICSPLYDKGRPSEGAPFPHSIVLVCHNREDLVPKRYHGASNEVHVDLIGMVEAFGWDSDEASEFVRQVLANTMERDIDRHWTMLATRDVCRHYLPEDDEFARRVELRLLRTHFHEGRLFELRRTCLPDYDSSGEAGNKLREEDELHSIVDRMVALGMTEDEVREEFLLFLREKTESDGARPQFVLAAAGAKCFTRDDPDRREVLRRQYLPYFWERFIGGAQAIYPEMIPMFLRLGKLGLWEGRTSHWDREAKRSVPIEDNDQSFFRNELVKMVACGRPVKAFQLIRVLRGSLDLPRSRSAHDDGEQSCRDFLASLVPEAFAIAYEEKQYGIAAALAQHYGEQVVHPDKVMESESLQAVVDRLHELTGDGDLAEGAHERLEIASSILSDQGQDLYDYDGWEVPEDRRLPPEEVDRILREIGELDRERSEMLEGFREARKTRYVECVELALDLEQPIRLDLTSVVITQD